MNKWGGMKLVAVVKVLLMGLTSVWAMDYSDTGEST